MTKRMGVLAAVAAMVIGAALVSESLSQPADGGGGGGRGGRGGFDPAAIAQRMAERMKEALGVNDEEWKVVEPKLTKVATLTFESRLGGIGGMGLFGGGRGGRGGDAATSRPAPTTEVGKAGAELGKVLADKEAKGEQIKTALQALRDARAKAKAELEQAQKDLREVLTVREEAVLVSMGMLE
ncbi:MAG: hypothetical protein NTV86_20595 [Planctomycetota bacterium]|nr:hypothetical protein [Planctomycetota bacterium]